MVKDGGFGFSFDFHQAVPASAQFLFLIFRNLLFKKFFSLGDTGNDGMDTVLNKFVPNTAEFL